MCSESGLADDPLWGQLGIIRLLDTGPDLCHSKVTHRLHNIDFTAYGPSMRVAVIGTTTLVRRPAKVTSLSARSVEGTATETNPQTSHPQRERGSRQTPGGNRRPKHKWFYHTATKRAASRPK